MAPIFSSLILPFKKRQQPDPSQAPDLYRRQLREPRDVEILSISRSHFEQDMRVAHAYLELLDRRRRIRRWDSRTSTLFSAPDMSNFDDVEAVQGSVLGEGEETSARGFMGFRKGGQTAEKPTKGRGLRARLARAMTPRILRARRQQ